MQRLELTEVVKRITTGKKEASASIDAAFTFHALCDRHITGEKWLDTIKKIDGLQNDREVKLAKEVSSPQTAGLFNKFRGQYARIFRADGFYEKHIFEEEYKDDAQEAAEWLQSKFNGKGLRAWMRDEWMQLNDERPNDFILLELPSEASEMPEPFIKVIPLANIYDYHKEEGVVCWLIIKENKKDANGEFAEYRYIDDLVDIVFIQRNNQVVIKTNELGEPDAMPNRLGFVPARQIGGVLKNSKDVNVVVNQYYYGLLQADKMQGRCNDHDLSVKKHAYPLFYSYPVTCNSCKGSKYSLNKDGSETPCRTCHGTGEMKFDSSKADEGISIPMPKTAGFDTALPNVAIPAGYVTRDNAVIELQRTLKQDVKEEIELSVMGVIGLIDRQAVQTATEALIDYQPVIDRFTDFSKVAEQMERFIAFAALSMRYNTTLVVSEGETTTPIKRYVKSVVIYGKKFHVKTADQFMMEFIEGKKNGVPDSELKESLRGAIITKYESNPAEKERQLLLLEITPFPTYTLRECRELEIGTSDQIGVKAYLNDIIEEIERDEEQPVNIYANDVKRLKELVLEKYKELTFVEPDIEQSGNGEAAKEKLRATVGGVTSIIEINRAVADGTMSEAAAETMLVETFGYNETIAKNIIQSGRTVAPPTAQPNRFAQNNPTNEV